MRKEQIQLLAALIVFILIMLLTSCTTERKATRYFNEHKPVAANYCAEAFPVKDSMSVIERTKYDTLYAPVYMVDTVVRFDTLINERAVTLTRPVKVPCPSVPIITKTVTRDSIHFLENTARIDACEYTIQDLQVKVLTQAARIDTLQDKVKHKNKAILWLLLIIVVESIYIFRKPLMSLAMRLIVPIKNIYPF